MGGIDARRLLKTYMAYVLRCEGVTFAGPTECHTWPSLTPPERQMIAEVHAEVEREEISRERA